MQINQDYRELLADITMGITMLELKNKDLESQVKAQAAMLAYCNHAMTRFKESVSPEVWARIVGVR